MKTYSRCADCPLARSVLDSEQLAAVLGLSPNSIASIRSRYPTRLPPPFLTRPLRWRLETVQKWMDQQEKLVTRQALEHEGRIQSRLLDPAQDVHQVCRLLTARRRRAGPRLLATFLRKSGGPAGHQFDARPGNTGVAGVSPALGENRRNCVEHLSANCKLFADNSVGRASAEMLTIRLQIEDAATYKLTSRRTRPKRPTRHAMGAAA